IPSIVGSMIMREVIGLARTAEMALSCRFVGAEEAHGYGLINEIVPPEQVLARAVERARELGAKPPTAMRLSRRWLRDLTQKAFDDAVEAATVLQPQAFATGEPQAAARAFVARRDARRPAPGA
ncbi:MAG: enoyl-CoA hydratase/isomerase family protein, partial [Alphaproteobacteria bacterium]